jgi:hypothetical protein
MYSTTQFIPRPICSGQEFHLNVGQEAVIVEKLMRPEATPIVSTKTKARNQYYYYLRFEDLAVFV